MCARASLAFVRPSLFSETERNLQKSREKKLTDRYTDKPFLRFVDAYVLKAIGHLDDATEAYCKAMVPSLEKSFGLKGSWSDIVAQRMKFAPELPEQIRKIWDEGRLRFAQANGQPADPVQFTYLFVDKNLQSV